MPSTSETGHAKNVTHFEQLISFCTGYGGNYNPSKATLIISNLTNIHLTAQSELQNVINATVDYNNFVNTRVITFDPIRKLSTRLVNAFSVTDATDEMIKDAKTINRKIQGKRAKEITTPVDPNHTSPQHDKYKPTILRPTNRALCKISSTLKIRAKLCTKTNQI
jgi:hypothetical protein